MNVLFWNTHGNTKIDSYIYDFVKENRCEIIILAEYKNNINGLCNQLSLLQTDFYPWKMIACNRIYIISVRHYRVTLLQDDCRYCIFSLKSAWDSFILAALHLPSKLHYELADLESNARIIKNDIEHLERKMGHRKTFVVGDFNVNPFESPCVNADCFYALPNGDEAKISARRISNRSYTTFYNPMWNLFGDFDGVSGSYFYNKNTLYMHQWNIYDQVILRPELIDSFVNSSLKIINEIRGKSLLDKKGRPNKKISDHLPIYFEIKEGL